MNRFNYISSYVRPKVFTPMLVPGNILRDKRDGSLVKVVQKHNGGYWAFGSWKPSMYPSLGPSFYVTDMAAEDNYEPND